jgi:hypothetical protein
VALSPPLPSLRAVPLARKPLTAAPAPAPSTSSPPTPDILLRAVQPGCSLYAHVQPCGVGGSAHAATRLTGCESSHAAEVRQELGQEEHGTIHRPPGGHSRAAEPPAAGNEPVQLPSIDGMVSQLNPPPSTGLAAQALALPVQQGAGTSREGSHRASQQAAAAPAVTAGGSLQGTSSQPIGEAPAPPAGDMVPFWDPDKSSTLLVPMPSQTGVCIKSVRVELDGVLLHADCTQTLAVRYRPQQQALAIIGPLPFGLALLAGARLLPSKLLGGDGNEDPSCLVVCASWPLAPPGFPVSLVLGHKRQDP